MRWDCLGLLGALVLAGCGGNRAAGTRAQTTTGADPSSPLIITAATGTNGKVTLVNANSGFVVVSYSFGNVPPVDRRLNVYRNGLKVAEIKVSRERRDTNTVADIVAGECQVGDEVRQE